MTAETALVFLDTETTGLAVDDEIWEFAAVRREPDGTEKELHLFLQHNASKCIQLPESYLADHQRRFPASHMVDWHPDVVAPYKAAELINEFLQGRPHIVGAVPSFDLPLIERLSRRWITDWTPPWHYHVIDVETVALGWLNGRGTRTRPPYRSDDLAAACWVDPPAKGERHTAMGDVRWVMRWYDAMLGGQS
jgi:hypothetical protein